MKSIGYLCVVLAISLALNIGIITIIVNNQYHVSEQDHISIGTPHMRSLLGKRRRGRRGGRGRGPNAKCAESLRNAVDEMIPKIKDIKLLSPIERNALETYLRYKIDVNVVKLKHKEVMDKLIAAWSTKTGNIIKQENQELYSKISKFEYDLRSKLTCEWSVRNEEKPPTESNTKSKLCAESLRNAINEMIPKIQEIPDLNKENQERLKKYLEDIDVNDFFIQTMSHIQRVKKFALAVWPNVHGVGHWYLESLKEKDAYWQLAQFESELRSKLREDKKCKI
eukprot:996013_1